MSSFYSDMIYEKILESGNEAVFIATDFLDIADYETARKALNRLDSYGKIKKICRGVYYNPKFSELLGEYFHLNTFELFFLFLMLPIYCIITKCFIRFAAQCRCVKKRYFFNGLRG